MQITFPTDSSEKHVLANQLFGEIWGKSTVELYNVLK